MQIEQDFALCNHKFPGLVCRPIAAQFMASGVIALFDFEEGEDGLALLSEKHYRLVLPGELTQEELKLYQQRS